MTPRSKIITFNELRKLRKPIHNVNIKHRESLSYLEKIAIAEREIGAILIHLEHQNNLIIRILERIEK